MRLFGSVEAGGTKFICAVGNEDLEILETYQFPTSGPDDALEKVIEFFKDKNIEALALGSFGPIDIDRDSETYGYVLSTPKAGWSKADLVSPIEKALNVPVYFTTDVNSSAYGEMLLNDCKNLTYFTVGTGIGAGSLQNGEFIGGVGHPEMGHQLMKRHKDDLDFAGNCPFHGDCLEGVAAGPSLEARLGIRGEHIPADHDVWDIQAYYIAQALVNATVCLRPDKIVVGGGVMAQDHMLDRIKENFVSLLNGYLPVPSVDDYIFAPSVENNGSATIGNFALAKTLVD
ncbi:ROK family protein [Streptococcaceae bacterium ESL0729]|nr:ROK family protein [Streptococcaceae bacterium ESL0729]